jgi:hypothetical protein
MRRYFGRCAGARFDETATGPCQRGTTIVYRTLVVLAVGWPTGRKLMIWRMPKGAFEIGGSSLIWVATSKALALECGLIV